MLHSQECLLPFNSVTIILSIRVSNYCELNDVIIAFTQGAISHSCGAHREIFYAKTCLDLSSVQNV